MYCESEFKFYNLVQPTQSDVYWMCVEGIFMQTRFFLIKKLLILIFGIPKQNFIGV